MGRTVQSPLAGDVLPCCVDQGVDDLSPSQAAPGWPGESGAASIGIGAPAWCSRDRARTQASKGDTDMWYVGIDWAGDHHDIAVTNEQTVEVARFQVAHTVDGLATLGRRLAADAGGPDGCQVAIERPDGLLVATLLDWGYAVYAVNPKAADRYRPLGAEGEVAAGSGGAQPPDRAARKRRRRGLTAKAGSPARLRGRGSGQSGPCHRTLPRQAGVSRGAAGRQAPAGAVVPAPDCGRSYHRKSTGCLTERESASHRRCSMGCRQGHTPDQRRRSGRHPQVFSATRQRRYLHPSNRRRSLK
jgi:Transposase